MAAVVPPATNQIVVAAAQVVAMDLLCAAMYVAILVISTNFALLLPLPHPAVPAALLVVLLPLVAVPRSLLPAVRKVVLSVPLLAVEV